MPVEIAMKVIVVVIAMLATVGLAVLGMFTARTLSSPTDHVVRVKSAPEAQGSGGATRFSNPVAPAASVSATPSSASAAVAPERMSQNDASSALAAVTATDNADVRKSINIATCDRPDAIGLSRIVDIDTRAGPEFGFQHLKGYDFLRDKEVVLTFDDGPRPVSTLAVLKALQDDV